MSQLLDVDTHPRKPQYGMVPEQPLLLAGTGFDDLGELLLSRNAAAHVRRKLAHLTAECEVRLAMMHTMRAAVEGLAPPGGEASGAAEGAATDSAARVEQTCSLGQSAEAPAHREASAVAAEADALRPEAQSHAPQAAKGASQSKRARKRCGPHVQGVSHIRLLQRATEPSFAERLAALRARGGTESVSQAQLRAMPQGGAEGCKD